MFCRRDILLIILMSIRNKMVRVSPLRDVTCPAGGLLGVPLRGYFTSTFERNYIPFQQGKYLHHPIPHLGATIADKPVGIRDELDFRAKREAGEYDLRRSLRQFQRLKYGRLDGVDSGFDQDGIVHRAANVDPCLA